MKAPALSRLALWLAPHIAVAPKRALTLLAVASIGAWLGFQLPAFFVYGIIGSFVNLHLSHATRLDIIYAQKATALFVAGTALGFDGLWIVGGDSIKREVVKLRFAIFILLVPPLAVFMLLAVATVLAPYGLLVSVPLLVFYTILTPVSLVPPLRRAITRSGLIAAAFRSNIEAARVSDWD